MSFDKKNKHTKLLITVLKTISACAIAYIILYMVDRNKNER